MGSFAIYLLHIERADGQISHYCGSTFRHRFHQRMHQHARGHSSSIHKAAKPHKIEIWCVRRWTASTRDLEVAIQDLKQHEQFCPFCNPSADDAGSDALAPFKVSKSRRPLRFL